MMLTAMFASRQLPAMDHLYADDDLGSDDHGGDDGMEVVHMMLINANQHHTKVVVMRMMMHDMVCR